MIDYTNTQSNSGLIQNTLPGFDITLRPVTPWHSAAPCAAPSVSRPKYGWRAIALTDRDSGSCLGYASELTLCTGPAACDHLHRSVEGALSCGRRRSFL